MDIQKQFTTQIRKEFSDQLTNSNFVIGVSGGVDSMALVFLFLKVKEINHDKLHIVHINHHLRPEANNDQKLVEDFCMTNHLDFKIFDWETTNSDIENQAREFRYQSFNQVASEFKNSVIVTAHHLDDQVETFLMKLIRGGDWRQLAGIRVQSIRDDSKIYRPLLEFRKNDLIEFAKENSLTWAEDETNLDAEYTIRNKLRNQIIPELNKLNSKSYEHIAEYAKQIGDLTSDASQKESIRLFISQQAPELSIKNDQLNQFVQLLNNPEKKQGSIQLSNGYLLIKDGDKKFLQKS